MKNKQQTRSVSIFGTIAMAAIVVFLGIIPLALTGCDDGGGSSKTDPTVTWPTGLTATVGQTLSQVTIPAHTGTTLGTFSWTTPTASVGAAGTQSHNMTFTPTDTAAFNTVNQNVNITVSPARTNPTVTWPTGLTATEGQTLADVTIPPQTGGTPGTFTWTNPTADVGAVGTRSHNMTFTPTDTATYNTVNQNVNITVGPAKTNPDVTWPTGLTATEGDTLADVTIPAHTGVTQGTFSWTNPTADVGAVGTRSHNMTFTPTDTATYNTVTNNVNITVEEASTFEFRVGDTGPGGGTIFFVADGRNGRPLGFTVQGFGNPGDEGYFATYTAHYLEVAPTNADGALWAPSLGSVTDGITTFTADTAPEASIIGNGRRDTRLIRNRWFTINHTAASRAMEYPTANAVFLGANPDTDDWFLPSAGEMMLYAESGLTLPSNTTFWTSSHLNNNEAWCMSTINRNLVQRVKNQSGLTVRPIRAF